ncbi:MAG: pilus assembly protein [Parasphingopyxis sp.]|uniref:TadE/TadG family type IV pilus assembly protein n=1 Tax=Parasphingopyxis sp. TaxID=1920299 RepID=UPI0032F04999
MIKHLIRKMRGDRRGTTIVEFGLILVPLMIVMLGAFDLGYQNYLRSTLQGAVNQTARLAAVEDPAFNASGGTLEERVEAYLIEHMEGVSGDDAEYTFQQFSYQDFSNVGQAEPLVTDHNGNGSYDDGDCWEDYNNNGTYDLDAGADGRGGADDVVFFGVMVERPRIVPVTSLVGVSDEYRVFAAAVVRTQPYATQAEPAVLCTANGGGSGGGGGGGGEDGGICLLGLICVDVDAVL